jgi:hypothetical protein
MVKEIEVNVYESVRERKYSDTIPTLTRRVSNVRGLEKAMNEAKIHAEEHDYIPYYAFFEVIDGISVDTDSKPNKGTVRGLSWGKAREILLGNPVPEKQTAGPSYGRVEMPKKPIPEVTERNNFSTTVPTLWSTVTEGIKVYPN